MLPNFAAQPQIIRKAVPLFWRCFQNGLLYRLWARFTHRPARLLELEETLDSAGVKNSHYAGRRAVEIEHIRGTQGKSDDFDATFHPIKESSRSRWLSIAMERLCGRELPPVDLVEVDGVYYVRDGHHRISVARTLGQAYIDAEIISMTLNRRVM